MSPVYGIKRSLAVSYLARLVVLRTIFDALTSVARLIFWFGRRTEPCKF